MRVTTWSNGCRIFCVAALLLVAGCALKSSRRAQEPIAHGPSGPAPSQLLSGRELHHPPPLAAAADVPRFVDWACFSTIDEREDARKAITSAAHNTQVLSALFDEVEKAALTDHPRALIALGIIGEMRNPRGARWLAEFARRPLPERGTVIEGEIIEQTSLAMLEGKAVDGLAYMRTPEWDRRVLELARDHPSRVVRAEAINAFLWNHNDGEDAKKKLRRVVRREDALFIDRLRHVKGEDAAVFNRRLAEYLKVHPEANPPLPEHVSPAGRGTVGDRQNPPPF
jgi:hypothetical protein